LYDEDLTDAPGFQPVSLYQGDLVILLAMEYNRICFSSESVDKFEAQKSSSSVHPNRDSLMLLCLTDLAKAKTEEDRSTSVVSNWNVKGTDGVNFPSTF
jgi:hypothetical protein